MYLLLDYTCLQCVHSYNPSSEWRQQWNTLPWCFSIICLLCLETIDKHLTDNYTMTQGYWVPRSKELCVQQGVITWSRTDWITISGKTTFLYSQRRAEIGILFDKEAFVEVFVIELEKLNRDSALSQAQFQHQWHTYMGEKSDATNLPCQQTNCLCGISSWMVFQRACWTKWTL